MSVHYSVIRSCPRWIKTREIKAFETEDFILPDGITQEEVEAFPEYIAETYEECSGTLTVVGYFTRANYESPGENVFEVGKCPVCRTYDWSEKEITNFKGECY